MNNPTKFGIAFLIFVFLMFWVAIAYSVEKRPENTESRKMRLYERCVSTLFVNGQAEEIINCEYIKK